MRDAVSYITPSCPQKCGTPHDPPGRRLETARLLIFLRIRKPVGLISTLASI